MRGPIVVVGSINLDMVFNVDRLPGPGETVLGAEFQMHPGGKGANQAGAVARLGYPVFMVGRVGSDVFGEQLRGFLKAAGADTSCVRTSSGSSGTAGIHVTPDGQNSIVVAPGANLLVTPADIDANLELIRSAALVLTQLEIPMETVQRLGQICEAEQVPLVLDPAPAQFLDRRLLRRLEWITPNEVEAGQLHDMDHGDTARSPQEVAESLLASGARNVLLKLGEKGSCLATASGMRATVPAFRVEPVDTTGAGDAFNGAFAVALARGADAVEAAQFASAAAAISVTRCGALPSIPTQLEVAAFLSERGREQREFAL
jgi:ribokinase